MSQNYFIKNLLNIKDENIFFENFNFEEKFIKNIKTKILYAILSYEAEECPHCHAHKVIKYGFKTSSIKMMKISGFNCILKLKKQRFLCNKCKKTFSAETSLVSKNCCISNSVKLAVTLKLKKNISEKDIAQFFSVSHNTVNRIIDNSFKFHIPDFNYLPRILCFDEFKSTKDCEGYMSFIIYDAENKKVIDILPDRRLNKLKEYFYKFPLKAWKRVKHITIDMYKPYIVLIKELFPNAKISIDRFHLVQLINRSFNKIRIQIMNKYKNKDGRLYRKLKHYWKLLLKDSSTLNKRKFKVGRMFDGRFMSQEDIINYIISCDTVLKDSYYLYQEFLYSVKNKNLKKFISLLRKNNNIPNIMKTSLKTFKNLILYIKNSLKYSYSNGVLEGVNCKIKSLKRTAYGYKSFFHFKNRILIRENILTLK